MKKVIIGAASAIAVAGIAYIIKKNRVISCEGHEEKAATMKVQKHLTDAFSKAKTHTVAHAAS